MRIWYRHENSESEIKTLCFIFYRPYPVKLAQILCWTSRSLVLKKKKKKEVLQSKDITTSSS